MKFYRQVIFGFLAAVLSVAVILGSLSLSLSETGLKLAINITQTRPPSLRFSTVTQTVNPVTLLPGETNTPALFTPTIMATDTPMIPFVTLTQPPTPNSCPPPEGWSPIKIQAEDTLESLAFTYNTTTEALLQANCLITEGLIIGAILYVPGIPPTEPTIQCGPPADWVYYTVQPGDTLTHIGVMFGVTVAELQFANCMGDATLIRAGGKILVPNVRTPTSAPTRQPTKTQAPTYTPTENPSPTPTVQPSSTPTPISSNTPIANTTTPTRTPRPTATSTPQTPSPASTNTPTETPTPTDTAIPTFTETLTLAPTSTETSLPSETPSSIPTDTPETPTLTSSSTP